MGGRRRDSVDANFRPHITTNVVFGQHRSVKEKRINSIFTILESLQEHKSIELFQKMSGTIRIKIYI